MQTVKVLEIIKKMEESGLHPQACPFFPDLCCLVDMTKCFAHTISPKD